MGDSKFTKRLFSNQRDGQAAAYWPQAAMITVFQRTYDSVEYLDSEENRHYYQVALNGMKFIAILSHAENAPTKIIQYGFICYFAGLEVTMTGMENLNCNLHISIAELDEYQNLILFSFIEAHGSFDENRFSLLLQAWHRDIVITFKSVIPDTSLSAMMPTKAVSMARLHGGNKVGVRPVDNEVHNKMLPDNKMEATMAAPSVNPDQMEKREQAASLTQNPIENPEEAIALLSRFLGAKDASRTLCDNCEGRGKIGLFARSCKICEGSGLSVPTS